MKTETSPLYGPCHVCGKAFETDQARRIHYCPTPEAAPVAAPAPKTASDFLNDAAALLTERGKTYDQEGGERSMGKCVTAFNAICGQDLSEAEGWLLLQVLKDVRQWSKAEAHEDSSADCVSYSALKAESVARGGKERPNT